MNKLFSHSHFPSGNAYKLSGGKFSNGAVSGAFVHMFNAEMTANEIEAYNKKVMENEKAFNTAYGKNGDAYMMGDTKVGQAVLEVGFKALTVGVMFARSVATLGYEGLSYIAVFWTGTLTGAGGYTAVELGFKDTNVKRVLVNKGSN